MSWTSANCAASHCASRQSGGAGTARLVERAVSGEASPIGGRRFERTANPTLHVQEVSIAGNENIRSADLGECDKHLTSRIAALGQRHSSQIDIDPFGVGKIERCNGFDLRLGQAELRIMQNAEKLIRDRAAYQRR
jgi:hypothetical protein